jgi:hypothetical protein
MARAVSRLAWIVGMLSVISAVASAQQTATTTTETKRFEVISVQGNDVVVRLPEGTKELTVPEDFRFTVDGKALSVHELKAGMKGTATITTKTTAYPVTVTEVKNGTVRQVTGSTILVQTDQGYKSFTQGDVDKRGVKIVRDGQPAQLSDFRAGDQLSATIITSRPPRIVTERQVQATLAGGASSGSPSGSAASAGAGGAAASTSASAAGSERRLPKTATPLPLVGLAGAASLVLGLALTVRRRLIG